MRAPAGLLGTLFLPLGPQPPPDPAFAPSRNLLVRLLLPGLGLLGGVGVLLAAIFLSYGAACPPMLPGAASRCTSSLGYYLLMLVGVLASLLAAWQATYQIRRGRARGLLAVSALCSITTPLGLWELTYGSSSLSRLPPLTSSGAWVGWLVLALGALFWGLYVIAEMAVAAQVRDLRAQRRRALGLP
jgi:hypothetical protein